MFFCSAVIFTKFRDMFRLSIKIDFLSLPINEKSTIYIFRHATVQCRFCPFPGCRTSKNVTRNEHFTLHLTRYYFAKKTTKDKSFYLFLEFKANFFKKLIHNSRSQVLLLLIYQCKDFFFTNSCNSYYNKTQRKPKQKPLGITVRETIIIADRQYIKL